jgi:4-carboxymuconolactone decarboxylase
MTRRSPNFLSMSGTEQFDHVPTIDSAEDKARYERGLAVLQAVDGGDGTAVMAALQDIAPALAHHVVAYGFGDIYARPGLDPKQRQLVTLGILTALGGCEPQLEVHVKTSLNVGLTSTEIVEALIHASGYCGFPKALNAIFVAKKVFAERGLLPVQD